MNSAMNTRPIELAEGLSSMLTKTNSPGMAWFELPVRWVREHAHLPKGTAGTAKLIEQQFYDQPFLTSGLENITGFHKTIEAHHEVINNESYLVRFNLLRLLHIDASLENSREDAISFYKAVETFFESHPDMRCDVQFTNHQALAKTTGKVTCRVWSDEHEKLVEDVGATHRLRTMSSESRAIGGHINGIARSIATMGPHSWMCLSEDQVFGPHLGPRHRRAHGSRYGELQQEAR